MPQNFLLPNGFKLSYAVYGAPDGYPVIGCHGLAGSVEAQVFDAALSVAGLRYILVARPGYGQSDFYEMATPLTWAEDMDTFFSSLGVDEFDIVGMSAGAVYAYALAACYPERVKTVYIHSGMGAIYKPDVVALYPNTPGFAEELERHKSGTLEDIADTIFKAYIEPLPEEMRQFPMIRDSIVGGCLGMAQTAKLEFLPWGFEIEDITQPVRMFHSRSDEEVPYTIAVKSMCYMQNATIKSYENEPHASEGMLRDVMMKIVADHS